MGLRLGPRSPEVTVQTCSKLPNAAAPLRPLQLLARPLPGWTGNCSVSAISRAISGLASDHASCGLYRNTLKLHIDRQTLPGGPPRS